MGGMGILLSRFVAKKRNAVNSTFLPFLTNAADRNRTVLLNLCRIQTGIYFNIHGQHVAIFRRLF